MRLLNILLTSVNIMTGVLITQDKQKISYTHYNFGHKEAVIIAHGFFNSQDAVLLKKLKDGLIDTYDVIMFDFRGHGKSSGVFHWTSKENFDLEAVLDYTKTRYERIGLIGFSLGAAISINVLAKHNAVNSFVAISCPSEMKKIDYRFWGLDLENDIFYNLGEGKIGKGIRPGPFWLKKEKPMESIKNVQCPVLFIHGDRDWVINHEHSRKLYERAQTKKEIKIIRDGPHAEYLLRKNSKTFISEIKMWFGKTLHYGGEI